MTVDRVAGDAADSFDVVVPSLPGFGFSAKPAGQRAGGPGPRLPCTPSTRFQIASVSRQFTAAAILLLVSRSRLALDDPVTRRFGGCREDWRSITVHPLLTRTGPCRVGQASWRCRGRRWSQRRPRWCALADAHGEDVHRRLSLRRGGAYVRQRDVRDRLALLQRYPCVIHADALGLLPRGALI